MKSIRDKTIGEIFDELCIKHDEKKSSKVLFKGRHPVTGEIMGLKIELMEV